MSEYGNLDLYEVFKNINDRLDGLEANQKYPTESREKFMGACMKDKSMKECSELWEKVKAKGEQAKAYGKPTKAYGKTFINAILEMLEKADIDLDPDEEKRLRALAAAEKTGETGGSFLSVLPQGETPFRGLKVNLATGELYRPGTEEEIEEFVDQFLFSGMEHQREAELTQQKFRERRSRVTQEQHEAELAKERAKLRKRYATGEDLKEK